MNFFHFSHVSWFFFMIPLFPHLVSFYKVIFTWFSCEILHTIHSFSTLYNFLVKIHFFKHLILTIHLFFTWNSAHDSFVTRFIFHMIRHMIHFFTWFIFHTIHLPLQVIFRRFIHFHIQHYSIFVVIFHDSFIFFMWSLHPP